MKMGVFRRFFFAAALVAIVVVAAMAGGSGSSVHAQEPPPGDFSQLPSECSPLLDGLLIAVCDVTKGLVDKLRYEETRHMCWVSGLDEESQGWRDLDEAKREEVGAEAIQGELGKHGFGGPNEFIVDRLEFFKVLGQDPRELELRHGNPTINEGFFDSFGEAVDLAFYADRADLERSDEMFEGAEVGVGREAAATPYYLLYKLLKGDVSPVGGRNYFRDEGFYQFDVGVGEKKRLPYTRGSSYMLRRVVADRYESFVRGFEINWVDASGGPAGSDVDHARLAADTVAQSGDVRKSSTEMMRHGNRVITGTGRQDLIANEGVVTVNCGALPTTTGPCQVTHEMNATTVSGQTVTSAFDINNHESSDSLPILTKYEIFDEEGNTVVIESDGREYVSHLDGRIKANESSYREALIQNTEANDLSVSLEVLPSYRSDSEFDGFTKWNPDADPVRAFGSEPITLANYANYPPFLDGSAELRGTVPRLLDLEKHRGYRQPMVTDPFADWDGGGDHFFNHLDSGHKNSGAGPGGVVEERDVADFYRIRWPVNLEDANWYLYELPGDLAADFQKAAFWHTPVGSELLVESAYSDQHLEYESLFNDMRCGFMDFDDRDQDGDYLDQLPVVNTAACLDGDFEGGDVNPVKDIGDKVDQVKGFTGRGLYPFWTAGASIPLGDASGLFGSSGRGLGVNQMGLDAMSWYLARMGAEDRENIGDRWLGDGDDEKFTPGEIMALLAVIEHWPVLVRSGVVSAEDQDSSDERKLNDFNFTIREQGGGVAGVGELGEVRLGVPVDPAIREEFFDSIPNRPMDPNHGHLMVMTFYESMPVVDNVFISALEEGVVAYNYKGAGDDAAMTRWERLLVDLEDCKDAAGTDEAEKEKCVEKFEDDQKKLDREWESKGGPNWREIADQPKDDDLVEVPKRRVRRVICRFYLGSAGHTAIDFGTVDDTIEFFNDVKDTISGLYSAIVNWYAAATTTLGEGPVRLGEETTVAVCDGTAATYEITRSESADPDSATVDGQGTVMKSEARESRLEHVEICNKVKIPDDWECASASDALLTDGQCVNLPQMSLGYSENESEFEFYSPERLVREGKLVPEGAPSRFGSGLDDVAHPGDFAPAHFGSVSPPEPASPSLRAKGLTKVRVDFDFAWPDGSSKLYDGVKGYLVFVKPDEKVFGGEGSVWREFMLPGVVTQEYSLGPGSGSKIDNYRVDGFWFGDLNLGADKGQFGVADFHLTPVGDVSRAKAVGRPRIQNDLQRFHELLVKLPVAPDYQHHFRIIPYIETADVDKWVVGRQISEIFTVDGNNAACLALGPGHLGYRWYRCEDEVVDYGGAGDGDEFRLGLMGLASSDLCGDIFSATPPQYTWDNFAVKRVWTFSWAIALTLFFVLLVWQGFRMTYDMWLNPRPATGFRELIPRFILALILASMSLFLCKWILILANDVTCFVAQTTGMTMWGVVGKSFLIIATGFLELASNLLGSAGVPESPGDAIRNLLIVLAVGFVVLIILIIILYLFVMLALKMLMRLALLAVCIAVSPVAFAFYASDATEHWTRKWVSIFLGAAFQQVMILIVVYLGAFLIGHYLKDTEGTFTGFLIAAVLSILVLSLANHIPKLVNPAGEGVFDSFGSLAKMGVSAAVVGATAGIGAAAGAVRGPGGGVIGGAMLGGGGGAGPAGAGGGGGVGGGGGPAGAPGGGAAATAGAGAATGVVAGSAMAGPAGTVFGGLASAGRAAVGAARHVGMGAVQGAQGGMRVGQSTNANLNDVSSGAVFTRYGRSGDDAARATDNLRHTMREMMLQQQGQNRGGP